MPVKFRFELEIEAPIALVTELMGDPDCRGRWQPELIGSVQEKGDRGHVGSQNRLTYRMNGRTFEIIETITDQKPPHEFSATYEAPGFLNRVTNRFAELGPTTTFWQYESQMEFTNLIMKLVGFLMGNSFRDQSWRYVNLFKRFAEDEHSGAA